MVMMQAKWAGVVATIEDMRAMIRHSLTDSQHYEPSDNSIWQAAYNKYLSIYKEM